MVKTITSNCTFEKGFSETCNPDIVKPWDARGSAYVGMFTLEMEQMCYYELCLVHYLERVGEELSPLFDILKAEQE